MAHLTRDLADATRFAYLTAWRRANVLGLRWEHVHLTKDARGTVTGGVIRLPNVLLKNKKPLTLPVASPRLLALLQDRVHLRRLDCPYVFHADGKPLRSFRAAWTRAATAVGRPGLLFHDLRRSAARNLRKAGVPETTIMLLGGWKSRSMLTRYDIHDENDLALATTALDAYYDRATEQPATVVPITGRLTTN